MRCTKAAWEQLLEQLRGGATLAPHDGPDQDAPARLVGIQPPTEFFSHKTTARLALKAAW